MQAVSLLWGRAGSGLQGKGGVVSSSLRLICQRFAGSASIWCWAPASQSCLLLPNRSGSWGEIRCRTSALFPLLCTPLLKRPPPLSNSWLVSFILQFTGDGPSLHHLFGHAFLLADVSLCMFSLQGSEWNASNLEDLQNRG